MALLDTGAKNRHYRQRCAWIPAGDPMTITYPNADEFIAPTTQPLGWQMDSGYTFRLLGGYAHVTDPKGDNLVVPTLMSPLGLQRFLADRSSPI